MPISNGALAFNVGRDGTAVIAGPNGNITIPNMTGFSSKQMKQQITIDRLDGIQLMADLPKGWTGEFEMERGSSDVDDFFNTEETAWFANGTYNVSAVYFYIQETNGSTSTYQFNNVSLTLTDAGSFKGDASVKQHVTFRANRRQKT